ncbi:hypothetical protein K4F52_002886 [Lecanicillium sp. MT-2017a]|nr:hypothetical protein K4F52_002886 [Lecanicillium sp. MT-2017a]
MRTESIFPESAQGTAKPTLKIDTTSHSYFKENSGAVLQKWFSNTVDPVAPPQLYNVPPPASLASQDSYDDMVSVSSYPNSQTPPTSHPQTASDISSQLSFANMPTDYGIHSGVGHAMTTRGRRPLPDAPTCLSSSSTSSLSSFGSASGYKRDAVSPKRYSEADNNSGDSDEADQYNNGSYNSPSPTLVRRNKDRFLVTARKSGMTYRDIKVKGGFSEAESTLRGRYRTLTKHRSARVRKPEWTDKDISLLKRGVRRCCKDRDPQHVKIPWKTVAKYIDENGGSYLFGNATCRKKWDELNEE